MADFLTTLKSQVLLSDGAIDSYRFELTGRLSETNRGKLEECDLGQRVAELNRGGVGVARRAALAVCYREQVEALVELVHPEPGAPPIIAEMTIPASSAGQLRLQLNR